LGVTGTLGFDGATTLLASGSFVSIRSGSQLELHGGVSGTSQLNVLAETGRGVLALGGVLNSALVLVPTSHNFFEFANFSLGASGLVLDTKGDILAP
jgi:hypothetical protein